MRTGAKVWRVALVGALAMGALAACGDDDEDTAATPGTGAQQSGSGGDNTLEIEMIDYGYKIKGELKAGLATISSTNTGQEFHMAGFGRLKPGKTVADVVKAIKEQGGPPGGGGGAEGGGQHGAGEFRAASAQQEGGEGGGEGGGEDEGSPLDEFVEEELGTPGHILQPGSSQTLVTDVLTAGNYVVLCFLPTEGEGTPHLAKGMVAGIEVSDERSEAKEPEADVTVILPDNADAQVTPAELSAGETTLKVTSTGSLGKDFFLGQMQAGKAPEDFDKFFTTEFEKEGGPDKGAAKKAPGTIWASTFELKPNQTIWITTNLKAPQALFVNASNSEGDGETVDKYVTIPVA